MLNPVSIPASTYMKLKYYICSAVPFDQTFCGGFILRIFISINLVG